MKHVTKREITVAGRIYKVGDIAELTDEQSARMGEYFTPVLAEEIKSPEIPPVDKMIRTNKIRKKGR